jgi:hypothetical protein
MMPIDDPGIWRTVICEDIQSGFLKRPRSPSGIQCFLAADPVKSSVGWIGVPAQKMIPVRYALLSKKFFRDPNPLSV